MNLLIAWLVRRSGVALLALSLPIVAATLGATAARAQLSGLPVERGSRLLTESQGPLRWRLTRSFSAFPRRCRANRGAPRTSPASC